MYRGDQLKVYSSVLFPLIFASPWNTIKPITTEYDSTSKCLMIRFHARGMAPDKNNKNLRKKSDSLGLRVIRELGTLPHPSGTGQELRVTETRVSSTVCAKVTSKLPFYTILVMTDPMQLRGSAWKSFSATSQDFKSKACRAGRFTGVGVFTLAISAVLDMMASNWSDLLDELDKTLSAAASINSLADFLSTDSMTVDRHSQIGFQKGTNV